MLEIFLAMPNLPEGGSVYRRTASRGVVVQDGRLLMIHTAAGDYKFPGGGVEPGETLQEALCREMLEETGRSVTGGIEPVALVHERRRGRTADILEMDSYYFLCQVGEEQAPLMLEDYERDEQFTPVWVELTQALNVNKSLFNQVGSPWLQREILVLERLRDII